MYRAGSLALLGVACLSLTGCVIDTGGDGLEITLGREASEAFEWRGELSEGQRLEINGINGAIDAEPSSNQTAVVTATRRGFRSDPDDVRIAVVEHDGGVTICAVYPDEGNTCDPGEGGRLRSRNNDVKVEFEARIPMGVAFSARAVNGAVEATSLGREVTAHTVNGSVTIATASYARAETVNGSITATLGSSDWDDEVAFETVNGSVTLRLPQDADTEVELRTSNGSIETELPVNVTRSTRRELDGTLGSGGRRLLARTVNGSVRLRGTE